MMQTGQAVLAIDPGKNGGIAWGVKTELDDWAVYAQKMPPTPKDIAEFILGLSVQYRITETLLEENRGMIPGAHVSTYKLAKHIGHIEMALICNCVPFGTTTPRKWMKKFLEGAVPSDKTTRKNAIKAKVQGLYPHIKVTLALADALGLLHTKIG